MKNILALCVATTLLLAGCGGGGDDAPAAPSGPVDPTNINEVLDNLAVKIGGQSVTSTSASNVPTASSDPTAPDPVSPDDSVTTTTSSSSKASIPVTFEGEAICNIFAKIGSAALQADMCPGGKSLHKATRGKARTLQTFIIEIELENTFSPTTGDGICFDVVGVDENGLASEPVQICVELVSASPENLSPIADAGSDLTAVQNQSNVQLNGLDSYDPDGSITYQWTQTGGPNVVLNGSTTGQPTFTAPATDELVRLTFQLTVTDDDGLSDTDEVAVDISPVAILTGQLRFTLSWDAASDLDLYVQEPSADIISYASEFDCGLTNSENGGCLDVDDTNGFGPENIIYESIPVNGTYCVAVDKFNLSDPTSSYTLTVNLQGQPVGQFTGSLLEQNDGFRWYVINVDDGEITSRAGTANDDPICPDPSGTLQP